MIAIWYVEWGTRENTAKDRILLTNFAQLDIVLGNEVNVGTFRKGGSASVVDLTFVSTVLTRCMAWHVT